MFSVLYYDKLVEKNMPKVTKKGEVSSQPINPYPAQQGIERGRGLERREKGRGIGERG